MSAREDETGERGDGAFMPANTSSNFGMTYTMSDAHDAHRDDHHRHGIKHGGDDLALDFLRLFHELGQAVQHDFKHAAQFAGLDHVDKQPVEDFRMLGQPFGKGAAAFNGQGESGR